MIPRRWRRGCRREPWRGVAGLALLAATSAFALPAEDGVPAAGRYDGSGYVTFGVGSCQHRVGAISAAGGGEAFVWKGLAVGGDIGYYRFVERTSRGFGIAGLNVGYHFVNRRKPARLDSFLQTSLLGAGFASGGLARAGSLGGGLNWWFKPRVGLRTEARVHGLGGEALVMFRIGLSFR